MGKATDVIFLVILLAGLLIAFPEYINKILENKIYTIFVGLGIFMAIFFIWLKTQNN